MHLPVGLSAVCLLPDCGWLVLFSNRSTELHSTLRHAHHLSVADTGAHLLTKTIGRRDLKLPAVSAALLFL